MTLSPNHTLEFSLIVNGAHLAGAVGSFALISALARSEKHAKFLWPATIACAAVMAGFLFFVSDPGSAFEDFRKAYWRAGAAIWGGPQRLADVFQSNVFGFVNLPIVAYFFAPFGLLPEKIAGALFTLISGAALLYAWDATARMLAFNRAQRALSLFALAAYGPLIHSLRQANASHLVLAILVWALVQARGKKGIWSGVGFGVAALFKPPLLLVGAYFFVRTRWKIVLAGAATLVGAASLSFLVFGWTLHVAWYEACIKPFLGGIVAAFNTQSVAAVLARLQLGTRVLWDWTPYAVSPFTKAAIYAASAALAGAAIWACRKGKAQIEIELAIVLALTCLISSLSWSHYFVWLLPGFAILFAQQGGSRPQRWALYAAFALAAPAQFLSAPMAAGAYPGALILVSHLAIGALIAFALLCALRARISVNAEVAPRGDVRDLRAANASISSHA